MGDVIGDILPLALGVAISPIPIIAVILMLLAPQAKAASVGFLVGWILGVTLVVTLAALLADPVDDSSADDASTFASVAKLVLGLLAVAVAARQWRSRPKQGQEPSLPKWMSAIDSMTALTAFGLGVLLSAANPKNLILGLAGGVSIASGDLSGSDTVVAIVVFVVVGSLTVATPVLAYLAAKDKMQAPLDSLRGWLTHNSATVMAVLMLVIGVDLIGKAIGGFW